MAASRVAKAEGSTCLPSMPLSYCALNDPACLRVIGDMYGFLDNVHAPVSDSVCEREDASGKTPSVISSHTRHTKKFFI